MANTRDSSEGRRPLTEGDWLQVASKLDEMARGQDSGLEEQPELRAIALQVAQPEVILRLLKFLGEQQAPRAARAPREPSGGAR